MTIRFSAHQNCAGALFSKARRVEDPKFTAFCGVGLWPPRLVAGRHYKRKLGWRREHSVATTVPRPADSIH